MPGGRPPKPVALHKIEGTYRPDRHGKALSVNNDLPQIPQRVKSNNRQRAVWNELVKELGPKKLNILNRSDRKALELLVDVYTEYLNLAELVDEKGYTYESITETGTMVRPNPEVAMKADAWRRFKSMAGEFGLTPAARNKVAANVEQAVDEYETGKAKGW